MGFTLILMPDHTEIEISSIYCTSSFSSAAFNDDETPPSTMRIKLYESESSSASSEYWFWSHCVVSEMMMQPLPSERIAVDR